MVVDWMLPDPKEAFAGFVCSYCRRHVYAGDDMYLAKKGGKNLKLCEDCAAEAEIDSQEVMDSKRESWLGEI